MLKLANGASGGSLILIQSESSATVAAGRSENETCRAWPKWHRRQQAKRDTSVSGVAANNLIHTLPPARHHSILSLCVLTESERRAASPALFACFLSCNITSTPTALHYFHCCCQRREEMIALRLRAVLRAQRETQSWCSVSFVAARFYLACQTATLRFHFMPQR